MKKSAYHPAKPLALPIGWRDAEHAALRANAADTCDDRVTEDIFEADDEREEVDIIVHGLMHDAN